MFIWLLWVIWFILVNSDLVPIFFYISSNNINVEAQLISFSSYYNLGYADFYSFSLFYCYYCCSGYHNVCKNYWLDPFLEAFSHYNGIYLMLPFSQHWQVMWLGYYDPHFLFHCSWFQFVVLLAINFRFHRFHNSLFSHDLANPFCHNSACSSFIFSSDKVGLYFIV